MKWIEEIEKLRDERGLSDAEIGAELGMSKQFTSDILRGKAPIGTKLKLKIWSRRAYDLNRDRLLAFLPEKVADEVCAVEVERSQQAAAAMLKKRERDDWVADLVALRDERGWNDAELAADLGMSKQYLSAVLNRKKPISWGLKVAVWSRRNYDLSRETLLALLPDDVATELIELDKKRGRKRAAKRAAASDD
jgi:transcriptional regulator with XRE-family HTH domain